MRRYWQQTVVLAAAVTMIALAIDSDSLAQPTANPGNGAGEVRGNEITPQLESAIEKGMTFLASRQQPNGEFGSRGSHASGITSLSAIAFMADGNLPGRGKYGQNVQKALDFILSQAQESGVLGGADDHGVMYSHGFATLFLAEVYGMTGDEMVKEKLQRAVKLIQRSQNAQGGWRYNPTPTDADVSVTICQVMALRAARDAGIKVERQVIERAIEYVKKCQNPDGGFNYRLGENHGSLFPRSAAGVATLFYAGINEGPDIERGLAYLNRFRPGRGGQGDMMNGFYFYGQYYAVQTMFLAGGDHWDKWFPAIRKELLDMQLSNGSWLREEGPEYSTAMALIILQIPKRYLPVFTGKGHGS
jgi:Prenyltransferase and squalene oxidase repeat